MSTATVSRALNGKPGVSAKLKHLIIEYARIHDYHPDSAARSMRLRRSNTIILVSRMDPFKESIPLAQMGETGLEHFGTDLKHVSIPSDSDLIESLAALEAHRHPPLFVVFGPCLVDDPARFAAIHTPILFILSDDAPAGYLTVASDDRHGARMVTESLIAAGHRDIMVLTERRNDGLPYYQHRIDGFRDALVAHGIPFRPSSVYSVSVDYSDYFHSSRQEIMRCIIPLLTAHHGASRPTALLVLSDFLAFTTVKALWDTGLRVPEMISVASFGGWNITNFLPTSVQTWVQPAEDLAQTSLIAATLLLKGQTFSGTITLNGTHPDGTHGVASAVSPTLFIVPGYLRAGQSIRSLPR